MAWTVEYNTSAQRQMSRLDQQVARRIRNFMRERVAGFEDFQDGVSNPENPFILIILIQTMAQQEDFEKTLLPRPRHCRTRRLSLQSAGRFDGRPPILSPGILP